MSKKFDFNFTPLNLDDIRSLSDDDLIMCIRRYRRMIKEARHKGKSTQPFEVEYCYLDHERQMREKYTKFRPRRESHVR